MRRAVDRWYVWVAVLVATGLLAWFLAGLHWEEFVAALASVRFGDVLLASLVLLVEYSLRGVRWYWLIGDVDPMVRFRTLVSATHIGAALNTFLPLRGGDLVRVAVVARRRGKPFATILSTTVVERLFDIFGFVGALVAMLVVLPDDIGNADTVARWREAGWWAGSASLLALVLVLWMGTRPGRNAAVWASRPLPVRVRRRFLQTWRQIVVGLAAIGNLRRLLVVLFLTAVIYGVGLLGVWLVFRAFALDLPIAAALSVEVAMHAAVAVPQAPGFIGVFQVVMDEVLGLWRADVGAAEAIAVVLWAVYFVPVTVLGLLEAGLEGGGLLAAVPREPVDAAETPRKTAG